MDDVIHDSLNLLVFWLLGIAMLIAMYLIDKKTTTEALKGYTILFAPILWLYRKFKK